MHVQYVCVCVREREREREREKGKNAVSVNGSRESSLSLFHMLLMW